MWHTRLCELLGIEFPILEGGMSICGNAELAAAVSEAGGLGMLGTNPGWSSPERHVAHLRTEIRKLRGLTTRPFGVNFTLFGIQPYASEMIDMALEEEVRIVVTSGGNPKVFTRRLRDAGTFVLHVVGNVKQAKGAEDAGVNAVIAEGYEAGGVNFLDELTTMVLIPYITDAVKVPVVAAGGIYDARSFVAAMALGADAVQLGSRFLATRECHVHQAFKEAIVAASDTDTNITRRKISQRVRGLRNPYARKLEEMDANEASAEEIREFLGYGTAREGMMQGDTLSGDLLVGQVAGMIKTIHGAGDVVREIIDGAEAILARCNALQATATGR